MSTSNDRSAGSFHGENDPDNDIEESEENDESDAASDHDSYGSYGSFHREDGIYWTIRENHSEEVYDFKRKELKWLKILGKNVNWEIEDERFEYFDKLYSLVDDWKVQLPDLRKIFHPDEMDFLLVQAAIIRGIRGLSFIKFVARTGYKDRFDVPEDDNNYSLLCRTTAVHHAAGVDSLECLDMVEQLFYIYDRFDVNYVDESGLTHFHAACMAWNCQDLVRKFLEQARVDPNLIWPETGDSPLHLSVFHTHRKSTEILMRKGANPNLANKDGLTPLHVAAKRGANDDIVRRIFEICEDMKQPLQVNARDNFGNTPLHLALESGHNYLVQFLLRNGANPNLANKDGLTPLHVAGKRGANDDIERQIFEICEDIKQPLQVNARDNFGNTPLHLALESEHIYLVLFLLRNGADPNLANNEGSTPLHIVCQGSSCSQALAIFEVTDEVNRLVQVDARDNLGRTPLQLAVLNLLPHTVESLLDHGADLSSLVLLPENDDLIEIIGLNKLTSVFAALAIYESLEKRGYEVDDYALRTMKIFRIKISDYPRFPYHMLSKHSANFETRWNKKKKLASKLKKKIIRPRVRIRGCEEDLERTRDYRDATAMTPTLSLYDLMRLRPEEAAKVLTCRDYFTLIGFSDVWSGLPENYVSDAIRHLYETVPRRFFRRWALDYFFELIGYRLPILCCEIIIDRLGNEDLCNICLAATGQDPY